MLVTKADRLWAVHIRKQVGYVAPVEVVEESSPVATVHRIERVRRFAWGRFFIGRGATVPGQGR
jgi:hypothetical protein